MPEITIDKITRFKQGGFDYQQRRHDEWTENYQLYRDKVIINRLTQRQSVNVPLMKETIKTILAKTDDAPDVTFEEKANDKQKELFLNEYWKDCYDQNKLEVKDIIDKKQVMLYGRSWKKLNIVDGRPYIEILDPQDILVDRYTDPADIETAFCIIHQHIYRTLGDLEVNPVYNKQVIQELKDYYASEEGLIRAAKNVQTMQDRNEKMEQMGDNTVNNPVLGETYVEITENYVKVWDDSKKAFLIHVVTVADERILSDRTLQDVLNINFFPFVTWADDIERTDFYSDGVADIVRTPNKILNSWISQLVENRTMRNFGMNYYDATNSEFQPATFQPAPFGWYPIPGDPNKLIKRVDIPDLSESLDEMQFIIGMVERSTAATATEKGEQTKGHITLGEIQLMAAKANERITSIAKFYRLSWRDLGEKWVKLVLANPDKIEAVKLYKKSYKGNFFEREVAPEDWQSEAGYSVKVTSSAEQEQENMETIQKFNAVVAQFPNNIPLKKIYHNRLLDLIKLTPEETKEVMDFEEQSQIPAAAAPSPIDIALNEQNKALSPQMAGMPA